jgi:hypothetical protein
MENMNTFQPTKMHSKRKIGLVQFVTFGTIALAICYGAYVATASGHHIVAVEVLAIPGGFALAGLVQAITGVSFSTLAARWQSLAGWQRGIVGVLIAVLAFALAIASMLIIGKFNSWV